MFDYDIFSNYLLATFMLWLCSAFCSWDMDL